MQQFSELTVCHGERIPFITSSRVKQMVFFSKTRVLSLSLFIVSNTFTQAQEYSTFQSNLFHLPYFTTFEAPHKFLFMAAIKNLLNGRRNRRVPLQFLNWLWEHKNTITRFLLEKKKQSLVL